MPDLSLLWTALLRPLAFARWANARIDRMERDGSLARLEGMAVAALAAIVLVICGLWIALGIVRAL